MNSAHLAGHDRHHARRASTMKRPGRAGGAPRSAAPDEFTLFSDRLDDAREYENTVRDFALVREQVLSADDYNS